MMIMDNPLISVIVPIYNVEHYLDECIKSIQNQTYTNLQIILVDDGSTDNSGFICDTYAGQDTRIEVVHQENQGLVAARKSGLRKANGDYIGFVDGDDYVEPVMYEILLKELINSQVDIVHTGYWSGEYEAIPFKRKIIDLEEDRELFLKDVLGMHGVTPSIWSKLFRAEVIKESYSYVKDASSYGEDLICLCVIALNVKKISLLDKAFYHYRIREDSISHDVNIDKVKKELDLYNDICEILNGKMIYETYSAEMDRFLVNHILMGLDKINNYDFQIQKYSFPFPQKIQNKRIVVYGAGRVGKDYYSQFCRYTNCEVVAWVDKYPKKINYSYIVVSEIEVLLQLKYDLIVVAVKSEMDFYNIRADLIEMGIMDEKIVWNEPQLMI